MSQKPALLNLNVCHFAAERYCKVEVEDPWGEMTVLRNMQPLKFYHDFQCGRYLQFTVLKLIDR